jgi:hypothetical protein
VIIAVPIGSVASSQHFARLGFGDESVSTILEKEEVMD